MVRTIGYLVVMGLVAATAAPLFMEATTTQAEPDPCAELRQRVEALETVNGTLVDSLRIAERDLAGEIEGNRFRAEFLGACEERLNEILLENLVLKDRIKWEVAYHGE